MELVRSFSNSVAFACRLAAWVWRDETGFLQELQPVKRFIGFFARDGLFVDKIRLCFGILAFPHQRAYRRTTAKKLLGKHKFTLLQAQIPASIYDTYRKSKALVA